MKEGFAILAMSLMMIGMIGCAGPTVSGLPIGTARVVTRGDIVEIRLPMATERSNRWRISEYDSLYLAIDSTPVVVRASNRFETLVRFRAKTRGVTHVEFVEVVDLISERAGEEPRKKRVRVRIT